MRKGQNNRFIQYYARGNATRKEQTIGLYNTCTWECDEERTNNRFIQYLHVGMRRGKDKQ